MTQFIKTIVILVILLIILLCGCINSAGFTGGGSKKNRDSEKYSLKTTLAPLNSQHITKVLESADTLVELKDIKYSMDYHNTRGKLCTTTHVGQVKLFLTELQFLTDSLNSKDDRCVVIYAGSAPSNKLPVLANLFPSVKWVLIDPNIHYLKHGDNDQYDPIYANKMVYFKIAADYSTRLADTGSSSAVKPIDRKMMLYDSGETKPVLRADVLQGNMPDNISDIIMNRNELFYVIEDYYSSDVSRVLAPLCAMTPTYFISDIRSNSRSDAPPTDLDIIWNAAMMYNWLKLLKPKRFMLKFRCPYELTKGAYDEMMTDYNNFKNTHAALNECTDIDFVENFSKGIFRYIKPEKINLQAFAGNNSTETRLVASALDLENYNVNDYNDKLFYYNRVHRQFGYHNEHALSLSPKLGIDRCGDCALMCRIYSNYINKYNVDNNPADMIAVLLNNINRRIKTNTRDFHGYYFNKMTTIELRTFLTNLVEKFNAR